MELWVVKSNNVDDDESFVDGVFSSREAAIAYVDIVMEGLTETYARSNDDWETTIFFKDIVYYIGKYMLDDTPMIADRPFAEVHFI